MDAKDKKKLKDNVIVIFTTKDGDYTKDKNGKYYRVLSKDLTK